ncbi:MAG TPA: trypsin-like peptidase domain-containing protein, partial [Acidimicrobiales bacterium]|nr:trypsin-like peptidase domain-containing protein [Acidimicrobiales bacterium]
MSDTPQPPVGGYGPARSAPTPPPPPEWIAAQPPWASPAAIPSPEAAPPKPARPSLAFLAAVMVFCLFAGIGLGIAWHLHGSRPTITDAAVTPATSVAPVTPTSPPAPVTPVDPTAPTTVPAGGGATTPSTPSSGDGSPSASPGSAGSSAAIAAKIDPSVVDINTHLGYQGASGAGTGMILTASGEILTNNHVIDGATSISVRVVETGRTYTATVVGTDPTEDVAIIQLQGASGLKPIPVGDSSVVAPGDPVVAIGNAGGTGGTPSVVTGTVQAVNQTITASDPGGANAETLTGLIQMNAPIQPGDSGGPLVNAAGQVIGMDTAASGGRRFSSSASVGFAIPIAHAINIAQQIESGHATATIHIGLPGFLGVGIGNGSGGSTGTGAVVSSVQPASPAAAAGLVAGDTITSMDGKAVDSAQTLSTLTKA